MIKRTLVTHLNWFFLLSDVMGKICLKYFANQKIVSARLRILMPVKRPMMPPGNKECQNVTLVLIVPYDGGIFQYFSRSYCIDVPYDDNK